MAPAFSSVRQAAGFALLLLVLLTSPILIGKRLLPPRDEIYSSLGWANGGWPYIHRQIFEEKSDIDIAIIGPSHIWYGVDDRYVQSHLSEQLGRPAVVRSFCWGVSGFDTIYLVAADLLAHRKVRLLLFYDDLPESILPHGRATRLFRYPENMKDTQGLSWEYRADFYLAAIIGMPRNLLDWFRLNRPTDLAKNNSFMFVGAHTENIVERLGSLGARAGFAPAEFSSHRPYEEFHPSPATLVAGVAIYPEVYPQKVDFVDEDIPSLQLHFIRKFIALAKNHETSLAMLYPPIFADRRDVVIREGKPWKELLPDLTIIGIPPAEMFGGLPDTDVEKLYSDQFHLNVNGQQYFTATITPALLKAYGEKTSR